MHVLLMPSWYPATNNDINGSFFREQAIALVNEGARVGVISPIMKSLRSPMRIFSSKFAVSYENDQGVHTYRQHVINVFPRMPVLRGWLWRRFGLSLYERYIEEQGRPDIIHVHSMLDAGDLAKKIKKRYSVPYVVTEHSTAFAQRKFSSKQIKNFRDISAEASLRFAVSSPFCSLLSEQLGATAGDWFVLPNIVKNTFFLIDKLSVAASKEFVFLNVCFLTKKKRIDLLLQAFSNKFKGACNVKLKIGGDGPERRRLVDLADSLGISGQVEFLGILSREKVIEAMSRADVFVLSSEYETFGVVVTEALALGKPVIATRCGGPEDIVGEEDGILVPVNDVESLSCAMEKIREEINKYDASEISGRCFNRFSEKFIAKRLMKFYELALSKNLEFHGQS